MGGSQLFTCISEVPIHYRHNYSPSAFTTTRKEIYNNESFFWCCIRKQKCLFYLNWKAKAQGVGWLVCWFFFPCPFVVDANLQKSWFNSEVLLLNFDLTPTFYQVILKLSSIWGQMKWEVLSCSTLVNSTTYPCSSKLVPCLPVSCLSDFFSRWFFSVCVYIVVLILYAFWLYCRDQFLFECLWCS